MSSAAQRLQRIRLRAAGLPSLLRMEAIAGLRLYKRLFPDAALPDLSAVDAESGE